MEKRQKNAGQMWLKMRWVFVFPANFTIKFDCTMPYCTTEMLVFSFLLAVTLCYLFWIVHSLFVNEKKEYNFVIRISVENDTMQLTWYLWNQAAVRTKVILSIPKVIQILEKYIEIVWCREFGCNFLRNKKENEGCTPLQVCISSDSVAKLAF